MGLPLCLEPPRVRVSGSQLSSCGLPCSACVFALLFPVTIVSAYEARHIDFATASTR